MNDPRYQVGQFLRRRFDQKPDEGEASVFALTISWSSTSRLLRSRYWFTSTSSTSSTVVSLIPDPSTVPPFQRTWPSAIPHTLRPVRRWSLGTSQPNVATEFLPIPKSRRPRTRWYGSSCRSGTAAWTRSSEHPASQPLSAQARSARPWSAASPGRSWRSARRRSAASLNVTTRSARRSKYRSLSVQTAALANVEMSVAADQLRRKLHTVQLYVALDAWLPELTFKSRNHQPLDDGASCAFLVVGDVSPHVHNSRYFGVPYPNAPESCRREHYLDPFGGWRGAVKLIVVGRKLSASDLTPGGEAPSGHDASVTANGAFRC